MSTPTPTSTDIIVKPTTSPSTPGLTKKSSSDYTHYVFLLAGVVAAIGAINWLLVAQADYNLVEALTGRGTDITKIVYTVVGICGFISLVSHYMWAASPKFGKKH